MPQRKQPKAKSTLEQFSAGHPAKPASKKVPEAPTNQEEGENVDWWRTYQLRS